MNLIVDQGNTATKLALFDAKGNVTVTEKYDKADKEGVGLWVESYAHDITSALVSSVTNVTLDLPVKKVVVLDHTTPIPLKNGYATPQTLGRDRLANAVAIWTQNPGKNSLCIDMGTCIKYDLVEANGTYLGGNISPGIRMRYKALAHFTDQLPQIQPADIDWSFGTTTESSIRNGVQHAIFHEINGFIHRYVEQFGELTIFMTGGDSNFFDKGDKNPIFANPIHFEANLTLLGLNEILKYNVEI